MESNPQKSIKVWKFFVKTHPDADLEAVVEHIVEETQIEILKAVGEWLLQGEPLENKDGKLVIFHRDLSYEELASLLRGEMPDEEVEGAGWVGHGGISGLGE